jgi:hypothetical protein
MKVLGRNAMIFSAALVAFFLVATPAAAQNVPNTWELTGLAGGIFGGQIYTSAHTDVDVATAFGYGARLGYNLTPAFEVEVGWLHGKSDLNATGYGSKGLNGKIGTLGQDTIEANALWHFGSRRASGYVVVGLGAMIFAPTISNVNASNSTYFTTSFGMGGKFSLSPRVALRVEGRLRGTSTSHTTSAGTWCDWYGYCYYYNSTWYSSGEATGGLLVRF